MKHRPSQRGTQVSSKTREICLRVFILHKAPIYMSTDEKGGNQVATTWKARSDPTGAPRTVFFVRGRYIFRSYADERMNNYRNVI